MSRLAGLGATCVSFLETGRRPDPQVSTLVAVARVYGVTLDWLVLGRGPAFHGAPDVQVRVRSPEARALVAAAIAKSRARLARSAKTAANDNAAAAQEAA